MGVREESILQPLKASDMNPDDWPEFNLNQIEVTSPRSGQKVSLLSAHQHNPLKVSGRLGPIDDDLIHLGEIAKSCSFEVPST